MDKGKVGWMDRQTESAHERDDMLKDEGKRQSGRE